MGLIYAFAILLFIATIVSWVKAGKKDILVITQIGDNKDYQSVKYDYNKTNVVADWMIGNFIISKVKIEFSDTESSYNVGIDDHIGVITSLFDEFYKLTDDNKEAIKEFVFKIDAEEFESNILLEIPLLDLLNTFKKKKNGLMFYHIVEK